MSTIRRVRRRAYRAGRALGDLDALSRGPAAYARRRARRAVYRRSGRATYALLRAFGLGR